MKCPLCPVESELSCPGEAAPHLCAHATEPAWITALKSHADQAKAGGIVLRPPAPSLVVDYGTGTDTESAPRRSCCG